MKGSDAPPDDPGRRLEELLADYREPPDEQDDPPDDSLAPVPGQAGHDAGEGGEGPLGTETEDEPDDALPDAPLFALLRTVQDEIEIDRIDRLWIFPPRRIEAGETAVVVVGAYVEVDPDRRRVYAAHYTVSADADEPRLALDEYGTAPADRVGRMVEEVVERIKDGPAEAPRSHRVDASEERWHTILHELAEAHLDEVRKNPRLRR